MIGKGGKYADLILRSKKSKFRVGIFYALRNSFSSRIFFRTNGDGLAIFLYIALLWDTFIFSVCRKSKLIKQSLIAMKVILVKVFKLDLNTKLVTSYEKELVGKLFPCTLSSYSI